MGQILDTVNYDEIDILPIELAYGDVVEIRFEPEAGEEFDDALFRMVAGPEYGGSLKEEFTMGNSKVSKDVTAYVVTFDTLGPLQGHKDLVFDVFGLTGLPKRRIGRGTITVKDSFA